LAKIKDKYIWDEDIQDFKLARPKIVTRILALADWVISWRAITKALIIAAALRLYQLGYGAFWYDEGVSAIFARLPFRDMIAATAGDVHPPLYYLLLWILPRLGIRITEFSARFPSFVLSVIAVYLAWELSKEFITTRRGRWAVLAWVIISPLQLHYAQEARMYALLQVEVLAAFIYLLRDKKIPLVIALAAIMYTHNYGVFYLPILGLAAFIKYYGNYLAGFRVVPIWRAENFYTFKLSALAFIKKWALCFIIPVAAWLPWFIVLAGQMNTVSAGYWIQPVKLASVLFVLYQMLFAFSMPPVFQGLGVLLTCGLLIYMAWRIYLSRPKNWLLLAVLAGGPLALAVVGSVVWRPILLFRGLIGSAIPLTILAVMVVENIGPVYKKYYVYSLVGITLLAGVAGHYLYNAENKGMTTTWVHDIKTQAEAGDVLLALNDNGITAAMTYAPELDLYKLAGCGQEALGSLSVATREALGVEDRTLNQLIPIDGVDLYNRRPYSRVWFISTVSPVSPQCEIDLANSIINLPGSRLMIDLKHDEYMQAGVYLIAPPHIY